MRLYIFKSRDTDLRVFVGDADGKTLPKQFEPWLPDGFVESGWHPPHNLSRMKIESAIKITGFQLWRVPAAKS